MPDGSRWDVRADLIAANRSAYFAKHDQESEGADYAATYSRETEFVMANPVELIDWAANNMNWSDVEAGAKAAPPLPKPAVDFQDGWINGDKEIVEY